MFRKEYARADFKEVSRYRWDQLKYDPQLESFSDFLKHPKKTVKQAFDSKANDYVTAFSFGKLPVAIQNDLSVAGKQDATVDDIRDCIQRRYQYQQLMGTQQPQPFNGRESGNLPRITYPTRSLVNKVHNECRINRHKRSRIITQESLFKYVDIRVTQHSHADTETPTTTPLEVSRTNARFQMRIEAFAETSNRRTIDISPSTKWKKATATPPTPEVKPTNLIL